MIKKVTTVKKVATVKQLKNLSWSRQKQKIESQQ